MSKKVNPNIYNQTKNLHKQSQYIEKKKLDYSIFLRKDLEIKTYIQNFFKSYNIIVNKNTIMFSDNFLYVYFSYYQRINYSFLFLNKLYKNKIIINCFTNKKIKQVSNLKNNKLKKTVQENIFLVKIFKYVFKKTSKFIELNSILEILCIALKKFLPNKYYILVLMERQNKNLVNVKNKNLIIKRKHKFINLRKYKNHKFFSQGINLITACIANKTTSKLLANYITDQIQKLKHNQTYFLKFIKSTLNLLTNNIFYSKILGIQIQIKGRINNQSKTKIYKIKILSLPPVLTKNANINFNQKIAYTKNGTLGVKVWIYEY